MNGRILVTGTTGYIGGRLTQHLLNRGYKVTATARSLYKLESRPWKNHPNIRILKADFLKKDTLDYIFEECDIAFYLVHSMIRGVTDFKEADRRAALNFLGAAQKSKLKRIIYLGGIGGEPEESSSHLKSRQEVGDILSSGSIPVTVLKAGHIIGSGSASFELLRYLSERLPFVLVPESISKTMIQPISVRNVINYLIGCIEKEETTGRVFEIGGPEILTYKELFEKYAHCAGLKKPRFLEPGITPFKLGNRFAFAVAKMIVPLPPEISLPLLEGLHVEILAGNDEIKKIIPQNLLKICESINRAIQKDSLRITETRWTDAGEITPPEWVYKGDAPYSGGTLLEGGYKMTIECKPYEIWNIIKRVGGYNGWYYGNILWKIRGWMDDIAGGVGLRRGRRDSEELYVGDAIDFWRVLVVKPPEKLILLAEMKLPGEAILNFEIEKKDMGCEIRLGTRFKPLGLYGIIYWYVLLPFHNILFGGMFRKIAEKSGRKIISGPEKYRPGKLYL